MLLKGLAKRRKANISTGKREDGREEELKSDRRRKKGGNEERER